MNTTKNNNKLNPEVKRIFFIISGFFFLFFLAIGYTIYIAQKNFEPIMDSRYYEKGLNYDERKKEFSLAKEKNWIVDVNILNEDTIKKEFNLKIKFLNDKHLKDFFYDQNREVVILKVSYPASIKKFYTYTFKEGEFYLDKNSILMQKRIRIPNAGNYEFSLELRPEKNAAMFYTKKIIVE
ncbi:MAG: FixH family protein [Leptonema sp. (in: bacteria)]